MRLHSLEVTAFGPFADTQRVDFDSLTAAGLFLLHGPTGAGKSSLLDAVCFALYGRVPGVRAGSRLRSDHAKGDLAPQVRCEFTVAGRRLEVTRAPEWQRPKRRGEGTVTERTHVTLREFVDGAWVGLTHRADEAGERLHELIGLGADQFTKLVLLPQGDFAAFLRASADERRTLLQKLFGTERFTAVEEWLVTRRRELERAIEAETAMTAQYLSRAYQALGDELPPGDGPADDAADPHLDVRDTDEVAAVIDRWSSWARSRIPGLKQVAGQAQSAFEAAQRDHDQALARARLRAQFTELSVHLGELKSQEAADVERQARWAAARDAVVLTPLLSRLRDLAAARESALATVTREEAGLSFEAAAVLEGTRAPDGRTPGPVAADDPIRRRVARLRADLVTVGELTGAEAELVQLGEQQGRCRSDLVMAEQQHQRAEQELASLTDRQACAAAEQASTAAVAALLPERQEAARRATEVARAVVEDEALATDSALLAKVLAKAIDRHQSAVAATLDLRERRLAGMAAELAAGLLDGESCPVCGAQEHPRRAQPGAEPVTDDAEQAVQAAQERAEQQRREAEQALARVERRRAAAQAISAGLPAAAAADLLRRAQAVASEAAAAQTRNAALTSELEALAGQVSLASGRREFAAHGAEAARLKLAAIGSRIEALQGPVLDARGDDESLAAREQRLTTQATALELVLDARRSWRDAQARYEEQVGQAQLAASAAGFDDVAAATQAWLDPQEQQKLGIRIDSYRVSRSRIEAQLADPRFESCAADSAGAEDRDHDTTSAGLDLARAAASDAAGRHTLAHKASADLGIIAQQLKKHAGRSKPLRERFAILDSVAKTAAGGGDNTMKMRLSSYVLAARLEQVAEAASVRLAGMSGGRYTLIHTDGPARGGARSGLGLAVIDGWSGTQRDPSSLSGGETFCTALALALGLADVVQAEAGGAVIETLLVDEGFGSLDADTLDEVMDVLDALRSGGRAVGLVSHVADLRDRIPARLEVVKTRTGSHLVA